MLMRFYGARSVSPTGKTGDAKVEAAPCKAIATINAEKLYYHAFVIGIATSPRHGGQSESRPSQVLPEIISEYVTLPSRFLIQQRRGFF